MNSIWTNGAEQPQFGAQQKDLQTNVLIIGGGMAGILCAYLLDAAGVDYLLVESDRICSGITKNTTAKLTFQHGLIYDKLIRKFGTDSAKLYLEANRTALAKYSALCQTIDCDFEEKDAFVYSLTDRCRVEAEVEAYRRLGVPTELVTDLPLPFPVAGAVRVNGQAQFHPLKFAYSIAKGLRILEHTKVRELIPHRAVTDHGTIRAKKIIVATHFPFLNKHGSYFVKLYQHRSYVIALENAPNMSGMYLDESETGLSFRNYGELLLLIGGSHRTGKRGGNWQELTDFARKHYLNAKEVARWATQDCMSLDGMPYIGQYSKRTPDLFVATGFNKWGMTSSMVAAMILADLVQGKENPYAALFSPSRSILHPQLTSNAVQSVLGLLTPTVPRCPHLGCALKYNKQEHSWDCPCHGSRFTEDGRLIDNPATDDRKR
ncbi:MAG: FAD-dependent oxidoreductase [Clostridia bacterium]|nr:FAD-dependent oxidoreductase [Clostridia bacterium]